MVLVCIYLFGFNLDSQSLIHLELELLELSFLKVGKKQKQSRQQNSWYYSCGPRDMNLSHIRRFQEYFNHIHVLIGSSILQFLQRCKYPFLESKSHKDRHYKKIVLIEYYFAIFAIMYTVVK